MGGRSGAGEEVEDRRRPACRRRRSAGRPRPRTATSGTGTCRPGRSVASSRAAVLAASCDGDVPDCRWRNRRAVDLGVATISDAVCVAPVDVELARLRSSRSSARSGSDDRTCRSPACSPTRDVAVLRRASRSVSRRDSPASLAAVSADRPDGDSARRRGDGRVGRRSIGNRLADRMDRWSVCDRRRSGRRASAGRSRRRSCSAPQKSDASRRASSAPIARAEHPVVAARALRPARRRA